MSDVSKAIKNLERATSFKSLEVLSDKEFEKTDIIDYGGKRCVRKVMHDDLAKNSVYDLLLLEQSSGNQLQCAPYIYEIIDNGIFKTVITEYLDGCTLLDLCEDNPMSLDNVSVVFSEILTAVSELHKCRLAPIIHRDIKPSNVFLTREGEVKLIDFGIARVEDKDDKGGSDTTLFGTRSYAPPEQFGYAKTTTKSDIFALGGVLYYMICGKDPDYGQKIDTSDKSIPTELATCINRARSFDPDKRYKTCDAFIVDFKLAIDHACERSVTCGSNIPLLSRMGRGLTHFYNAIIIFLLALFLIGCIAVGFDTNLLSSNGTYAQGMITLIFGMIIPSILLAFLLYSKKPFAIKHPNIKLPKVWQQIVAFLISFCAFIILFCLARFLNI